MLTIGGLAWYTGVTVKTIRVYHAKGLLPEPGRDASGYRRYGAQHVIDLIKIRTLAEAGVPLARIREIRTSPAGDAARALREVDAALSARISALASCGLSAPQHGAVRWVGPPATVNDPRCQVRPTDDRVLPLRVHSRRPRCAAAR